MPLSPQSLHILIALAERDQHGYAIMQDIVDRTDGRIRLSAGTLYGSIKRLLEQGLINELSDKQRPRGPDEDARRRYYRLSALGRKTVTAEVRRMSELMEHARACGLVTKSN